MKEREQFKPLCNTASQETVSLLMPWLFSVIQPFQTWTLLALMGYMTLEEFLMKLLSHLQNGSMVHYRWSQIL